MTKYAHSGLLPDKSDWQTLEDHLHEVSRMAGEFAAPFDAGPWAEAAGALHDAGKAYPEFQLRLEGKYPAFDHSSAGARLARLVYPKNQINEGNPLVPIVSGHHTGLQNNSEVEGGIRLDSETHPDDDLRDEFAAYETMLPPEDISTRRALLPLRRPVDCRREELATFNMFTMERLIFSSLVDADWLDTERVRSPENYEVRLAAREVQCTVEQLLERLVTYRSERFSGAPNTPVNSARAEMLERACQLADSPTGIFLLDMPTGSGKTLTSLEFALRHAKKNHQTRVVYAIPFMSIVEQNARVFKEALGRGNVLEHFSSYDFGFSEVGKDSAGVQQDDVGLKERMLVQNWSAPVIVTTNVQLFESLFSNRTTRSRKVHNIANSVIVLDEAQNLPDELLKSTLAMLESLVCIANVSVVICTATQPGLEECMPFRSQVKSIIDERTRHAELFGGRVEFDISHVSEESGGEGAIDIDCLADEIASANQALCVVSSRRAAAQVFDALRERLGCADSVLHLSALMVPEHRTQVLEEVRHRLRVGEPCRLVSTQLIEAGVDVDFPLVLRELTGIDSILQAAGRCNREGALGRRGRVVVFECKDFASMQRPSRSWLAKVKALGRETLKVAALEGWEPFGAQSVAYYFKRRHQVGNLDGADGKPIYGCIVDDHWQKYLSDGSYPFETISERYRFIDNEEIGVFVPWGEGGERLLGRIESDEAWGYDFFPQIQRHSINVAPWSYKKLQEAGQIRRIDGFPISVLEMRDGSRPVYDEERGLLDPETVDLSALIV